MDSGWIYFVFVTAVIYMRICGTEGILCYQCADTTDEKARAACLYNQKYLMAQRSLHEEKREPLKNLNRLKNCSHYVDRRGEYIYQYCKIERIHAHGVTNAFIRDCSDGLTFGLNITRLKQVRGDNQTICGYSQLHVATVCVSICDTDFCNGPFAAGHIPRVSALGLFAIVLAWLVCNYV